MDPTSTVFGWAIFGATFLSPIAAVIVTRLMDSRREKRQRQVAIFRQLMANRRAQLSPEYVAAMNVVEIEFYGVPSIIDRYKELMDLLSVHTDDFTEAQHLQHWAKVEEHFVNLLHSMADRLGYRIQRLDLRRGGYAPKGWQWREQRNDAIQQGLAAVLNGRRPFPIFVVPDGMTDGGVAPSQGSLPVASTTPRADPASDTFSAATRPP